MLTPRLYVWINPKDFLTEGGLKLHSRSISLYDEGMNDYTSDNVVEKNLKRRTELEDSLRHRV